jgi:hypothetical protein
VDRRALAQTIADRIGRDASHHAVLPPSTIRLAPVMKEDASDTR